MCSRRSWATGPRGLLSSPMAVSSLDSRVPASPPAPAWPRTQLVLRRWRQELLAVVMQELRYCARGVAGQLAEGGGEALLLAGPAPPFAGDAQLGRAGR